MPNTSIQGDDFPAHVIWDKSENVKIRVKYPDALEVKEVFNVDPTSVTTPEDGVLEFTNFILNGYVGFVLHSKRLEAPLVRKQVAFEIESLTKASTEHYQKEISLFRPALEVINVPQKVRVRPQPTGRFAWLDQKIRIRNTGDGTAIIQIELQSEEGFEKRTVAELDDFRKRFIDDVGVKLNALSAEEPARTNIILRFLRVLKEPLIFNDEGKAEIKSIFDDLVKALQDDETFMEKFASSLATAFLKNMQILTEINSFMEYLNSIGEGRVILVNSTDVIRAKKPSGLLRLKIRITDLAYNDYPFVELPPIAVRWEGTGDLPVHMLFDWRNKHKIGPKKKHE
jgi:hypothetical protein